MKRTGKTKTDKKELTNAVTARFVLAMHTIIAAHKRDKGNARTIKDFAASIGANASFFPQFENPAYGRNATVEMCCELCRVHNIDANWLMMGTGTMYQTNEDSASELMADLQELISKYSAGNSLVRRGKKNEKIKAKPSQIRHTKNR